MRIVVAMSGGVDSSVAAYELKRKGYDVIGATIKTWPKESCGADEGERMCCSLDAIQHARSVAEDMDIPYYVMDLSEVFAEHIKKYFVEEYARGRTPNPCVYCNSKIKFGFFLEKALQLGAEKIATGHYARILETEGQYRLAESLDEWQDQSYFLYDMPREVLSKVEFPLGELSKDRVREIAHEQGFMSAGRKASQDICFASTGSDYREYLEKEGVNAFSPGDILDSEGNVVGKHKGIASYTVGQRKGIGLAMPEPVYVLKIDTDSNTITIGPKEQAMRKKIRAAGFNWLTFDKLDAPKRFDARIRYNGDKHAATVTPCGEDEAIVEFEKERFAPTPGQAVVFYEGEIVAGGGWIEEVLE